MNVQVHEGDDSTPRQAWQLPLVIILDRLRSAYNVGNVFRIADAVNAEGIVACGYTACPPHDKLSKTARGCDEIVTCTHTETCLEAVLDAKARGYRVYAVETVENAQTYCEVEYAFPCAIVMGNEALGIEHEVLEQCDGFVSLPAVGRKNSINVGNACAVVVFEIQRQYNQKSLKL